MCPGELRAALNLRGRRRGSAPQLKRVPLGSVMVRTHIWLAAIIAGLIGLAPNASAQILSGPDDTVWVADRCAAGRTLMVQVRFANTNIYHTSFTICRRQRSQIPQTHWQFSFTPWTRLHWSNDSTASGELVSGDIWQAGGDSDALELGVSMEAHNQILVNTIHLASPSGSSTTPIDDGLVVVTMLVPPRGPGPRRRS